jgi:hypothetical protein
MSRRRPAVPTTTTVTIELSIEALDSWQEIAGEGFDRLEDWIKATCDSEVWRVHAESASRRINAWIARREAAGLPPMPTKAEIKATAKRAARPARPRAKRAARRAR